MNRVYGGGREKRGFAAISLDIFSQADYAILPFPFPTDYTLFIGAHTKDEGN